MYKFGLTDGGEGGRGGGERRRREEEDMSFKSQLLKMR